MTKLYAVVNVNTKTIKSEWFIIENEKVKNVTSHLFNDVVSYNEKIETTKIPYSFKGGKITYSFGCGLTHYLQNDNLKDVTTLDVDKIVIFTTTDFAMYNMKKNEQSWSYALETILKERGKLVM